MLSCARSSFATFTSHSGGDILSGDAARRNAALAGPAPRSGGDTTQGWSRDLAEIRSGFSCVSEKTWFGAT